MAATESQRRSTPTVVKLRHRVDTPGTAVEKSFEIKEAFIEIFSILNTLALM